MILTDFALGLGSGLALAAALYLFLRWWGHRAGPDARPDGPNGIAPAAARELLPPTPVIPEPPDPVAPPSPPNREPEAPASVPDVPRGRIALSSPKNRPVAPTEQLRLSQRIILHVLAQGTLLPGQVAPPALCQAGIGEALGLPQAGLAAVLRRLEAADILIGERGHVRGHDRRLKVYRLTPRGLELANEIRRRRPRTRPPAARLALEEPDPDERR